jgi:hypothetical protein
MGYLKRNWLHGLILLATTTPASRNFAVFMVLLGTP